MCQALFLGHNSELNMTLPFYSLPSNGENRQQIHNVSNGGKSYRRKIKVKERSDEKIGIMILDRVVGESVTV